jgi:hypothetical protein
VAGDADAVVRQHADLESGCPGLIHQVVGVRVHEAMRQVEGQIPEERAPVVVAVERRELPPVVVIGALSALEPLPCGVAIRLERAPAGDPAAEMLLELVELLPHGCRDDVADVQQQGLEAAGQGCVRGRSARLGHGLTLPAIDALHLGRHLRPDPPGSA